VDEAMAREQCSFPHQSHLKSSFKSNGNDKKSIQRTIFEFCNFPPKSPWIIK
jgi:hypothetical protein